MILWNPYNILAESIPKIWTSQTNISKRNHGGLDPKNHHVRTQKEPDGSIRNKCYQITSSPNTTITANPTKFHIHQNNGTRNVNSIGDMRKHDHSK